MLHFLYFCGGGVVRAAAWFRRRCRVVLQHTLVERVRGLWEKGVSVVVTLMMFVTSLPLGGLVPVWVAYAAGADAVFTGAPSGRSNVTVLDVTVGSDNSVSHYKYDVVAGTACTGLTLSASTAIATKITENISSIADGSVSLCVAGSTDGTTFDDTPTKATWTKDTVAPTITGGGYNGATIGVSFSEEIWGTPDATDFTIINTNGSPPNEIPETIEIAGSVAEAAGSSMVVLKEDAAPTWSGTVKVYYTQNSGDTTKRVKDIAGNVLASVASDDAVTLSASSSSAPTATLTGAPSGTSNAGSLNVTVGGSNVSAYKHFVVNSGVASGNKCLQPVFKTGVNNEADALAVTEDRVYIVEVGDNQSIKVYNRTTGAAVTSEDIALHADNDHARGMTTDGTTLWVLDSGYSDGDNKVYAYTISSKTHDSGKDFDLDSANGDAFSITKTDTHFYVLDESDSTVYAYTVDGSYAATNNFGTSPFSFPEAITTDGTHLFVSANQYLRAYTMDGTRAPAYDIRAHETSGTYQHPGLSFYDSKIYIVFDTATQVAFIPLYMTDAETAVGTAITDSLSSVADGEVSLCVVGRNGINQWQVTQTTATWTKDTTPPTISSGKYGGTTVQLTMSEGVYGTAEANDFTVVNDSGGTPANVTPTGITIAATKAAKSPTITLTVPETTWTGTVKVYYTQDTDSTKRVKDGADNVLASIASGSAETLTAVAAPSATLTGAPSGSSATTTLDVTVGGTDVTHYRQYAIEGSACVAVSGDLSGFDFLNDHDMAVTSDRIYIADSLSDKLTAYTLGGIAVVADDIALHTDNGDATGTDTDGTTIWVADEGDDKIYAYTLSTGARDTSKEINLHSDNTNPQSIARTSTHFYVTDYSDHKVYVYSSSGTRDTSREFPLNFDKAQGVATDGTYLYFTEKPFVKAYQMTGGGVRVPARDVYLGTNTGYYTYRTLSYANGTIYTVGTNTSGLDHLRSAPLPSAETAVATKITRNISALADGSVSLCAAGKNDIGQWQEAPTKATWTKAVPPTLSSATYSGTTVTVTMSEDVYAPTAPTASDFKVKVGSNANVVTAIAGLPTAKASADNSFTLTVTTTIPSNSTVKVYYTKGTNAVKDSTDNELATLAEASAITATAGAAAPSAPSAISLTTPAASPGNDTTPTFTVTVGETGGTVTLYSDSSCTSANAVSSATSVTDNTSPYTVDVTTNAYSTDGAKTVYAKHTKNSLGSACSTATGTYTLDTAVPTISSVSASGTTLTVTMSEDVYAATEPDTGDFTFSSGTQTVSDIDGLPTTAATADNSFTLTISAALSGSPTLTYTQNSADAKIIKDEAGNNLATVTGKTISGIASAPSAPTLALQSPASSPGSDSTPTIRVTVDSTQQNGTVELFSDSGCTTSLSSSVTVDAATEDVTTTTLTEANSPYTIYAKHTNSSNQGTCSTTSVSYTYDGTAPTISTAIYSGSTITLTMSENVAVSGTKTGGDFTITGGGDPTVSSYAISGSTITLTLSAAITDGATVTLAYAKNGTEANRITDTAGNELAAVTSKSVTGKSISVSAVSTDDYINDAEDENALTISGTSAGLTNGTTITVGVDGSGTDISGRTGTTDSDGDWSVSLTSDEVKALDASTPDADGEELTITATSTGATSGTRTVTYDPTAPGISTVAASGTTLTVTMDESVYAATVPDNGDFTITGGGAPTISNITGLPTTVAAADTSFTLTISAALTAPPTIAYDQNSADAKIIKDKAGNKLADVTGKAVSGVVQVPTGLDLAAADDTGTNTDNITKNTSALTVSGCAKADSTVTFYKDGTAMGGPVTADGSQCTNGSDTNGKGFTKDLSLTARAFAYAITAKATSGGVTSAASTALNITVDTTAPAATYGTITTGSVTAGSTTYLNTGDTVAVSIAFPEPMAATAPTVQFKNDTSDLGSAATAAKATILYSNADATGDSGSTTDALDFGSPTGAIVRETVASGGYVYKTTRAFDSLYFGVSGDASTGVALIGRMHSSKPTSSTINTAGSQIFLVGSHDSTATDFGSARLTDVASGTYIWFYPSALRTVTNREITIIEDINASEVVDFSSGSQAAADSAGASDPIDYGTISAEGIEREVLGSGYVYKTTEDFRRLYIATDAHFSATGNYRARMAPTAPTTTTIASHGTEMWSHAVTGGQTNSAVKILSDVPSGTYLWFYPTVTTSLTNRLIEFRGTNDIVNNPVYTAAYTVASGDTVASGNLKYDVTNESLCYRCRG